MSASTFILISSGLVLGLGFAHLLLTYFSRAFHPSNEALMQAMKTEHAVITKQTTLWRAQTGFHASHSMGAMMFGLIYGYLALRHSAFLFETHFLTGLGISILLIYLFLARYYWFFVPLIGIALACVSFAAGLVTAYA